MNCLNFKMLRLVLGLCLLTVTFGFSIPTNFQGKIIGGEETTIEKFPYQVSFQSYSVHICGGSILNANSILTAAHCTDGRVPDHLSIRAGSTNKEFFGQRINVVKIIQHEKYNRINKDNDVSILKLETPLEFGPAVQPIQLRTEEVDPAEGIAAVIAGWGRTVDGVPGGPDILRFVEVSTITWADCKAKYTVNPLTERMLCCTSDGKDSCQGDSGGPLVANNRQIGVVSWGKGCANPKYPGVYASISKLRPWIEQHAQE